MKPPHSSIIHRPHESKEPVEIVESLSTTTIGHADGLTEKGDAPEAAMREKLEAIPYDLVPFQEIANAFSRVAEHGATKYAPWNWSLGLSRVQLICSLLRHTFAYLRGEDHDKDSGLLHTDHILWNAAALSHNVEHNLEDARRKEPKRDYK